MKRRSLNLIVDSGAFAALVVMISTGFVLRFVLPPGSGRLIGEGTGHRAAQKTITLLWGYTRHEWGDFHFWASMALMVFLLVHFFLHWRWMYGMIKGQPEGHSGPRLALGAVALVTLLAFAAAPFLTPTQKIPRAHLRSEAPAAASAPIRLKEKIRRHELTLRDVEEHTGTPVRILLEGLDLPANISPDSDLRRLRRIYGVRLEDIQKIVDRYEEANGVVAQP